MKSTAYRSRDLSRHSLGEGESVWGACASAPLLDPGTRPRQLPLLPKITKKSPVSKFLQVPPSFQNMLGILTTDGRPLLDIGAWGFSGIWSLKFGAYCLAPQWPNSSCHQANVIYNQPVSLKRNFVWLGLLTVLAMNVAGCGGFTGSQSISPATFLLPGILKNETDNCTNSVASLKTDATEKSNTLEITSVR
jgi:hypothetical protein